jgi:hypothetical protein
MHVDQALTKTLHDVKRAIPEPILTVDASKVQSVVDEAVTRRLVPILKQENDMEVDQFVESSVSRFLEGMGFRKEMVQIMVRNKLNSHL